MRKLQFVFMTLAVLCFAVPAFADGGSAAINLVPIGAGIGMALAAGLCGLGQGKATASACEALARNPGARGGLMIFLILGLALIESLTLFTLCCLPWPSGRSCLNSYLAAPAIASLGTSTTPSCAIIDARFQFACDSAIFEPSNR